MTFSFRIHLSLGRRGRINEEAHELCLYADEDHEIKLHAAVEGEHLASTGDVILLGSGYSTENGAETAANQWRTALLMGFAHVGIGADTGVRQEGVSWGSYSPEGEAWIRQMLDIADECVVYQDRPGIIVYPSTPSGRFIRLSAQGHKSPLTNHLVDSVRRAHEVASPAKPAELLAYNLFNESLNLDTPDVRFVCLMMAIECLLVAERRGPAALAVVDDALHGAAKLPDADPDKASLIGSLRHLKKQSIAMTGRKLASQLEGLTAYMGESPVKFFNACYKVRSQLVHGDASAPSRQEVDIRAASLEVFVADLLSVPVLGVQPGRALGAAP